MKECNKNKKKSIRKDASQNLKETSIFPQKQTFCLSMSKHVERSEELFQMKTANTCLKYKYTEALCQVSLQINVD